MSKEEILKELKTLIVESQFEITEHNAFYILDEGIRKLIEKLENE